MIAQAFGFIIGRWQLSLGILAGLVLALSLSYCKGRSDGRSALLLEQAEARAETLRKARKADGVARTTVDAAKATSAAEIETAREAARDSDDPWKSATEAMR